MKTTLLVIGILLTVAPTWAQLDGPGLPAGPSNPVFNKVVDLLDVDVPVTSGGFWVSETFGTGAYTSYAILPAGNVSSGATVFCGILWKLSEDGPHAHVSGTVNGSVAVGGPVISPSQPVNGTHARIFCDGSSNCSPLCGESTAPTSMNRGTVGAAPHNIRLVISATTAPTTSSSYQA